MTDPAANGEIELIASTTDPATKGQITLFPAPKVRSYLEKEYGSPAEADALVAELGVQLERWLAPGGSGSVPTVADIPTKKILTDIDYRGIVFDPPKMGRMVAIVAPFGSSAGRFLITGIEPLSSLHADGVDFGVAGIAP